jgi:hypothetical protein
MQARRGHCELHIEMSTESCTSSDAPQDKAPALYHTALDPVAGISLNQTYMHGHNSGETQTFQVLSTMPWECQG